MIEVIGKDAKKLDLHTILAWRRHWHPTPYSCLENPMDGGAW